VEGNPDGRNSLSGFEKKRVNFMAIESGRIKVLIQNMPNGYKM